MSIVVPTPGPNKSTPAEDKAAAAADPTLFQVDPLQLGEILLNSWMLYTSQAPILDLTDKTLSLHKTLNKHFMLLTCAQQKITRIHLMAEKKPEVPTNPSKSLTDSDTSDDSDINPRLKTSVEEREYGTIVI